MNSPYDVLGISPLSGEAEIRAAYRRLSAKYYSKTDSVSLKKMDELNDAFDKAMRSKHKKTEQAPVSEFSDVRRLIHGGRLSDAEEILDSVRSLARGGEWNYLKALILSKRGMMREACAYIERALEKDNLSEEFNALYKRLKNTENNGQNGALGSMLKKVFSDTWRRSK